MCTPFYVWGGKRADLSPDGKLLTTPMDTCYTRGIASAFPALGLGVRASSMLTRMVKYSTGAVSYRYHSR